MNKIVAVIAAHPDDEILGCGGTIAKHTSVGNQVHVLIMAEGLTSRAQTRHRETHQAGLSKLANSAHKANDIVGVSSLQLLDFPDNRMDSVDRLDVIKAIERFIKQHQPEIIYTHHHGDVNIDHRILYDAVITACRPQPLHCVKRILSFEVNSSTEWQPPSGNRVFMPNWFEDVTGFFDKKTLALQAYESEMRAWPHSRSIEAVKALANYRGSTVGVEMAEAFSLIRMVV